MLLKNKNYKLIIEQGLTLDATTARHNSGTLFLCLKGIRIHGEPFKTNGKGTRAVIQALEHAGRSTHLDSALQALLRWADNNHLAEPVIQPDPFIDNYNTAVHEFCQHALEAVQKALKKNPYLSFESQFRIWSVEMQYLIKTRDKDWVMS